MAEGTERIAWRKAQQAAKNENKAISSKIGKMYLQKFPVPELSEAYEHIRARQNGESKKLPSSKKGEAEEAVKDPMQRPKPEDFVWLSEKFPDEKFREDYTARLESWQHRLAIQKRVEHSVGASLCRDRVASIYEKIDALDTKLKLPSAGTIHNIYDVAASVLNGGPNVLLIKDNDTMFLKPSTFLGGQCSWCRGIHKHHFKSCPLMQQVCAIRKEDPFKLCDNCDGKVGCQYCVQGLIPDIAWTPKYHRAPWILGIRPETLQLMHSAQNLASTGITDFNSPHLSGALMPDALLALGLLAEAFAEEICKEILAMASSGK